ncbi:MAG TPA: cyclic nucleotide-gated ion channel [Stellaceae bacterium]|nr:cyclic nucleotide-gated ion channel [Stellaceae bacterium]
MMPPSRAVQWDMDAKRLYEMLTPEGASMAARLFRTAHHALVAIGTGVILADSMASWRQARGGLLAALFCLVSAGFAIEYAARLYAAPAAPGARHRSPADVRLAWALSAGGIVDLLGALAGPASFALGGGDALLFGLVWLFKPVRYAPGLVSLGRVVARTHRALLSLLLGFGIILVVASSLAFMFEHEAQQDRFGSLPAALWWAIVTLTTTGYGDVVPQTPLGRILAGLVMIGGILVLALLAGILASGYADEMRRNAFLNTWKVVAKLPFFQQVGAPIVAEVARLLRPRDYPGGAVICRRGEPGDCMYFIASGAVEIRLSPAPLRLGSEEFFGEIALLTGAPRNATVVAAEACTLLRLDIADFHELMARQPELAQVIEEEAKRRLGEAPVPSPPETAAAPADERAA